MTQCELCENEPVLRDISWEKPGGKKTVMLHLGARCIRKLLGD